MLSIAAVDFHDVATARTVDPGETAFFVNNVKCELHDGGGNIVSIVLRAIIRAIVPLSSPQGPPCGFRALRIVGRRVIA